MGFKIFSQKEKETEILSILPDGVIMLNFDGKIEWLNDAVPSIFNIDKTVLSKSGINDVIESGFDLIKQAAKNSRSVVGKVKTPSAKDLFVEITAKMTEQSYVAAFRDVTQNYKTVTDILTEHENSKRSNKDKNSFLVKLSNELRAPIQSVIGFSQAMVDGLGGSMSDKQEKYVKIINKNSSEVLYLLNKIIEMAKTEANLFEYDYQIFDIVNSIRNMSKEFENQAKQKKISISFDASEIVKKTIFSDEESIKRIMQNIMETSLATTDIGTINITMFHPSTELLESHGVEINEEFNEKNYIAISVSDTGAGYTENELDIIFEPYLLLDKPNKKNIVRSIALASSKNIVTTLNGFIWVESEPMQGSTYSFIIPVGKFM